MKSLLARLVIGLCPMACLGQAIPEDAARQMANMFGRGMVQPAPPRAGDALLSCAQIAKEMADNLRARKVQIEADARPGDQCDASRPPTEAMMAQAANAMRAMNDPRLLRLALLAQEKSCAMKDPVPPSADKCGATPAAAKPQAATAGNATNTPPASPPVRPDPFRPR
jgi:hypothetical protein